MEQQMDTVAFFRFGLLVLKAKAMDGAGIPIPF